jgi:hypothetical protein
MKTTHTAASGATPSIWPTVQPAHELALVGEKLDKRPAGSD